MTDEELIKAYQNGDENAFRDIIKRYESLVAATVYRMLGKCPEAEDVGQETFIRFHNSLDKFRKQSSVGTYITRIAINLSLNELKRRKRNSSLFFHRTDDNDEIAIPEENGNYDSSELVNLALQKLTPKFRSVVVLRLIEGYSVKETAEILKLPVGTILSRLARAQQKLKKILSPHTGDK